MTTTYLGCVCRSRSGHPFTASSLLLHGAPLGIASSNLRRSSTQYRPRKRIIDSPAAEPLAGRKDSQCPLPRPTSTNPWIGPRKSHITKINRVGAPARSISSQPNPPPISTNSKQDLSSTRPIPLLLPESPAPETDGSITIKNRAYSLYKMGVAYTHFYKSGFMNVWHNYKEYSAIRKKFHGTSNLLRELRNGSDPSITRREFQLVLRTRHDIKKLIPFGLVFLICGEFTPLAIVSLGTAIVPYTCRIPKQMKGDLQKMLFRIENLERIVERYGKVDPTRALAYVHGFDRFGLSIRDVPLLGSWLWQYWIEPRLRRRLENIICDAMLVKHEGGAGSLEIEELLQICISTRKVNTMSSLVETYDSGTQPAMLSPAEIGCLQEEVQFFINNVSSVLMAPDQEEATCHPESIFVEASLYTASKTEDPPFIPSEKLVKF